MAKTKDANFYGALKAYFFFTQRYLYGFYMALGFIFAFAIFISLAALIALVLNWVTGEDFFGNLRFIVQVIIFFSIGLQAILALVTIAFHLWQITLKRADVREEFPETLRRMHTIRTYYDSTWNFVAKFLAFFIPSVAVSAAMVIPLFVLVYLSGGILGLENAPPHILRGIFIPDYFLVWLSVFLMNLHYYLGSQRIHEVKVPSA